MTLAPFGWTVEAGTTAGTAGNAITIVRKSFTGFTYDDAKTGTAKKITISGTPGDNVIKLYFKRNVNDVQVSYSGDVPAGAVYTPATQSVKYGATVNLTAPSAVTGYTFTGWTVVSGGVTISGNSFTMPNNAVVIEGVWSKNKFNVTFKNSNASYGTLGTPTSQSIDFGGTLSGVPTTTAKDGLLLHRLGGLRELHDVWQRVHRHQHGHRLHRRPPGHRRCVFDAVGLQWQCRHGRTLGPYAHHHLPVAEHRWLH